MRDLEDGVLKAEASQQQLDEYQARVTKVGIKLKVCVCGLVTILAIDVYRS